MYSRQIINRRIERASVKLGFTPEYRSADYIRQIVRHFDEISEFDQQNGRFLQWRRPLEPDEIHFIRGERVLAMCDFEYWLTRYAYIRATDERVIPLSPNIAQRIMLDLWAENEELGRSNCFIQLKARQIGVSTLSELATCHRAQFYPNVTAIIASCDPGKSELMAKMVELAFDQQPHWIKPPVVRRRVGELIEFPVQNSGISIQHGTQKKGIARGTTPSIAHMSELSEFENPEDLIDASLFRAMHSNPHLFIMLESTAKGRRNWWHNTWQQAKEDWPSGRSRLRPIFLPWFIGQDLYPTDTYMRECPLETGWRPLDVTLAQAEKARRYVEDTPLLQKYLGVNWVMSRRQMWFYEVEREIARKKQILPQFLSEMPGSDIEAFNSTNFSAFDPETIAECRDNVRHPLACYGIQSLDNLLPVSLEPSATQIDEAKEAEETISVVANWSEALNPARFLLKPLRLDSYPNNIDFTGKLFIYEWPMPDERYYLGIDTGDGVGQDRSVVQVLRKGTLKRPDEQVAEFASAYVNSHDLSLIGLAIGTLYSAASRKQPQAVIEVNRNGETVQHEMKKMGWRNFHQWVRYDSKKIDVSKAVKLGWVTNSWSRPMALDCLMKYVSAGWLRINSPWFVDEMGDLERSWDQQDLRAVRGGHDDRIMSVAIALLAAHVLEVTGRQKQVAEERQSAPVTQASGQSSYLPQPYEIDRPGQRLPVHQILGAAESGYAYTDDW